MAVVPEAYLFVDFDDKGTEGSYSASVLCQQLDLEWGVALPNMHTAAQTRGTAAAWDPDKALDPREATGDRARQLSSPHRAHLRVADRDPAPTTVRWSGWALPQPRTDPLWARWDLRSLDYARLNTVVEFPRFNAPPDQREPPPALLGTAASPRVTGVSATTAGRVTVTAQSGLDTAYVRHATRNAGWAEAGPVALVNGTGSIDLVLTPGVQHRIAACEDRTYATGAATAVAVPLLPLLPLCAAGEVFDEALGRCVAV